MVTKSEVPETDSEQPELMAITSTRNFALQRGDSGWSTRVKLLVSWVCGVAISIHAGRASAYYTDHQVSIGPNSSPPYQLQFQIIPFTGGTATAWISKGMTFAGLVCPDQTRLDCASGDKTTAAQLMDNSYTSEIAAAQSWGIDTIRFQVNQAALDPNCAYYQSWYLPYIINRIRYTRRQGLVVIISMQWESSSLEVCQVNGPTCQAPGWAPQLDHPTSSTASTYSTPNALSSTNAAWKVVAPFFASDHGVVFEAFNEPGTAYGIKGQSWAAAWHQWQSNDQSVINTIRSVGANNVIVLEGLQQGRTFKNMPMPNGIIDPANLQVPQIGYAVHPYENDYNSSDPYDVSMLNYSDFTSNFGYLVPQGYPMMISELSGTAGVSCYDGTVPGVPSTPTYMNGPLGIINYAKSRGIGISGAWAFDDNPSLVSGLTPLSNSWPPLSFSLFNGCNNNANPAGPGYDFQQYFLNNVVVSPN